MTNQQTTLCPLCRKKIQNTSNGLLFHVNCGIYSIYAWVCHFFDGTISSCYFSKQIAKTIFTTPAEYNFIAETCIDSGYHYFITTEKNIILQILEYFIFKTNTPTLQEVCSFMKKYNALECALSS